ncbi:Gfo/Idh/MocA family oxidoreductase, partial [Pseudomonas amygdali pv. mori str. 301020]
MGSEAFSVFVMADALIAPDYKNNGFLDTAVVMIRFGN